jgi:hypothetical protein
MISLQSSMDSRKAGRCRRSERRDGRPALNPAKLLLCGITGLALTFAGGECGARASGDAGPEGIGAERPDREPTLMLDTGEAPTEAMEEVWRIRYNGPSNFVDAPTALTVDGSGQVYVTGYSVRAEHSFDIVTIKYGPDGQREWLQCYDGPGNANDYPTALVVDAQGNIYVTGYSPNQEFYDDDFVTIKYGPAGKSRWVRRYNGGNGPDRPWAIAVDAQGGVYVAGESGGVYTLLKYSATGQLLWLRQHAAGAATALALDSQGNVYVTGFAAAPDGDLDYTTVKQVRVLRRAALGATL